jgi:hypothetical protein
MGGARRALLDSSGAAVADGDLPVLDDHGDPALPLRVAEHLVEVGLRRLDVAVIDGVSLPGIRLTGVGGVGSAGFSKDNDGSHG